MSKLCTHCKVDISRRDASATLCFKCLYSWPKRAGAAKAHQAVSKAVSKGLLPRARTQKCADCGRNATGYDHRDYSRPLAVDPVCHRCNKLRGPANSAQAATETVASGA